MTKPVTLHQLEIVLGQACERIRLLTQNKAYQHYLEDLILERTLKLRDSDIRFRTLFESANDAIILMLDRKIVSCNSKALQFFARTEEEIVGCTLLSLSPPTQREGACSEMKLDEYLRKALEGEPQFYEWRHTKRDGEPFDAEISLNRLKLQGRDHLQAIMRDITERKKAEAALLYNTRLKRELEIARSIQQSLLPRNPPHLPGMEVACCCLPASSVGGDYFDFFTPEKEVLEVFIADVAGHSIGAALLMVEARSTLHARKEGSRSLGSLFTDMNRLLYGDLWRAELQMSMFGARFDTGQSVVTCANAGHVRPLLLRHGADVIEELDTDGLLMGISQEVGFEETGTNLGTGDLFLFFTDGLTDAENSSGEFFGGERLKQAVIELRELSPDEMLNLLLVVVTEFADGAPLQDDITLVAVRTAHPGSPEQAAWNPREKPRFFLHDDIRP